VQLLDAGYGQTTGSGCRYDRGDRLRVSPQLGIQSRDLHSNTRRLRGGAGRSKKQREGRNSYRSQRERHFTRIDIGHHTPHKVFGRPRCGRRRSSHPIARLGATNEYPGSAVGFVDYENAGECFKASNPAATELAEAGRP
jgi:hypothetical protein